jgi:hypothetical protein
MSIFDKYLVNSFLHTEDTGDALPAATWSEDFATDLGDFVTSGSAVWTRVTNDGNGDLFSAKSGAISHNEISILQVTKITTQASTLLQYDYKTSTEEGFDYLHIVVDGQILARHSGTNAWTTNQVYIHGIGSKVIQFIYYKDTSNDGGTDEVWVDNVGLYNVTEAAVSNTQTVFNAPTTFTDNIVSKGYASFNGIGLNHDLEGFNDEGYRLFRMTLRDDGTVFNQYTPDPGGAFTTEVGTLDTKAYFVVSNPNDSIQKVSMGVHYTGDLSEGYIQSAAGSFIRFGESAGSDLTKILVVNGQSIFRDDVNITGTLTSEKIVITDTSNQILTTADTLELISANGSFASSVSIQLNDASGTTTVSNSDLVVSDGSISVNVVPAAVSDLDRFLVHNSGTNAIQYRTGAQVLSDIGAQAAGNYLLDTTDTFTGVLTLNNTSTNTYLVSGGTSQRVLIGGGNTLSTASGAIFQVQGQNYPSTGLGGNIIMSFASGKGLQCNGYGLFDKLEIDDDALILPTADYTEDFAAAVGVEWTDTPSSNAGWTRVTDEGNGDLFSFKSDAITHREVAGARLTHTTTTNSTLLKFDYKTSTEGGFDFLLVNVDGATVWREGSGTTAWTDGPEIWIHGIGSHTIDFIYSKDNNTDGGTDECWIDNIAIYSVSEKLSVNNGNAFVDGRLSVKRLQVEEPAHFMNNTIHSGVRNEWLYEGDRRAQLDNVSTGSAFSLYNPNDLLGISIGSYAANNIFKIYDLTTDVQTNLQFGVSTTYTGGFMEFSQTDAQVRIGESMGSDTGHVLAVNGKSIFRDTIRKPVFTVATLPAGVQGDTAIVTNAINTTFRAIVSAGGSNVLPVYYDGTNWRIG